MATVALLGSKPWQQLVCGDLVAPVEALLGLKPSGDDKKASAGDDEKKDKKEKKEKKDKKESKEKGKKEKKDKNEKKNDK